MQFARYTCPKCHVRYCSGKCYKDEVSSGGQRMVCVTAEVLFLRNMLTAQNSSTRIVSWRSSEAEEKKES